jgi:hypothetical protein
MIACLARAERVVALYFSVRSDCVVTRLGARSIPRAQQPKKFPYLSKKAEGGAGEAAKKMKGNFWFARHYDLSKSSIQMSIYLRPFHVAFLRSCGARGASRIRVGW